MTKEDLIPWKPGQSGNPRGRPKERPIAAELKKLAAEQIKVSAGGKDIEGSRLELLARVAWGKAMKGDFRFVKELLERIDGKVIEQIDLTADVNVQDLPGLTEKDLAKLGEDHDGPE